MSRYVLKFYKEGYIRYTSHLDILRLFKRSFKRVEVKLQYSQGFNPHPKMSFAQPLSLGYSSSSEYLEFETIHPYSTDAIIEKLNSVMPEGLGILTCTELASSGKTLAALTEYADYEIMIPIGSNHIEITKTIEDYMSQETIMINKLQRKSGKEVEVDIKPMIKLIQGEIVDNYIMLTMKLCAGSTANLSPEMVLSTFCLFSKIDYDRAEVNIKRTGIDFNN